MPFLSEADRDQLQAIFDEQLAGKVRLRLFTQPPSKLYVPGVEMCASCEEAEPFVRELASLSDKLAVVIHDVKDEPELAREQGVEGLLPAIVLEAVAAEEEQADQPTAMGRIRFLGLPAGYEFSTLVADLVDLSNQRVDLSEATQQTLRALDCDLHLQVFVTPT